jgi:subtilisin family serine protease
VTLRKRRRFLVALAAPVLLATGVAAAETAHGGAATKPLRPVAATAEPLTVTLVTGDRVTAADPGSLRVSVQPGAGRQGVKFLTRRSRGHLEVIPADALPLLRSGRLDERLFDVTALREAERTTDAVPLIMGYPTAAARAAVTAPANRNLPALNGLATNVKRADLGTFWAGLKGGGPDGTAGPARTLAAGSPKVWLDGVRHLSLDVSVPMIGGPAARAAGLDGTGVKVAVLDSGIDATHPDLAGKVVAEQNFTDGYEDNRDLVGHGTHIASTIAGSGAASGGKYTGVAPGAQLLDGKVCAVDGCADSWLLAGMQWAADQGASVVNLSLGNYDAPGLDPVEQAVQTLTEQRGMLFVVAAGNDGTDGSIESPADVDAALAVGAVDKSDHLADFSSRGPRTGDKGVKPDLTAPGVDIVAARSKDASEGEPVGDSYLKMSGTSMATPHVTGSAAILKQQHPQWTAQQLKGVLMGSTKLNDGQSIFAQGAGRVDVGRAITQPVYSAPPSIAFGRQPWPHTDDTPVTEPVTYHNDGTKPVTLALSITTPAPAGMFSVSAPSVTVPAGGTAQVNVTADPRVGSVDGDFGAYLSATGDGMSLRTPLATSREAESYDVTLVYTQRDGKPSDRHGALISSLNDAFDVYGDYGTDSTVTLRVPKGRYTLAAQIVDDTTTTTNPPATELVQPVLDVSSNQTVHLDARTAKPVTVTPPDHAAQPLLGDVTIAQHFADGTTAISGFVGDSFDNTFIGRIGPAAGSGGDAIDTIVNGRWAVPGPGGTADDSPDVYALTFFDQHRMDTGFHRAPAPRELATVKYDFGSTVPGAPSGNDAAAVAPNGEEPAVLYNVVLHAPFTRTMHYSTEGGVKWSGEFVEGPGTTFLDGPDTRYEPAREYRETWNRAVCGPSLGPANRNGDEVFVFSKLLGDGAGHSGDSLTEPDVHLYRDGTEVPVDLVEGGIAADLPAGDAAYTLRATLDRPAPVVLSTHVAAAWTFRSGHTAAKTDLPLSVVTFTPPVDAHSVAPAGGTVTFPVTVHGSATAAPLKTLTVDVSFDDGATWTAAAVHHGTVTVRQPARNGFVSLRAHATDRSGDGVEETVLRAYQISK